MYMYVFKIGNNFVEKKIWVVINEEIYRFIYEFICKIVVY